MAVKFEFYEVTQYDRYTQEAVSRPCSEQGANQHRPLGTGDTP